MIEARGLAKHYGRISALRNLNLMVADGECIALFGRNGAGKTTFLKIAAGLSRPSSGTIAIQPAGAKDLRFARGAIGYLSHNTSLYVDLTAIENLRFFAHMLNAPAGDEFLMERISRVGLSGRENEPIRNYSRGMQQRLAIARAFLHDPGILLLDEPFTGLDPAGSDFLKSYLLKAHAAGKTCIMALHDEPLGYELADRLVVMDKGSVALDVCTSSINLAQFKEKYRTMMEA
jgi:heme exporter protein A